MYLAVDAGTSRIHVGVFDGDRLTQRFSLATDLNRTSEEYAELLDLCLRRRGLAATEMTGAAVANVVTPLQSTLLQAMAILGIIHPLLVGPGIKTRLKIRFEPATELGADRIANAVAASRLVGPAVIVVDLGTATTFDCIVDGEYVGGVAAPGVASSFAGLTEKAPRLPRIDFAAPERVVARHGTGALQAGLIVGHAAMCDGLVLRIQEEIGDAVVVLTGDYAELIGPLMRTGHRHEPALTLQGLRILHEMNR
ncbi:MAG TPA: type III pantothenate kinase [Bacillota bacterium]|nr:type III pantothenate kinase [Bacillota bacterium]